MQSNRINWLHGGRLLPSEALRFLIFFVMNRLIRSIAAR